MLHKPLLEVFLTLYSKLRTGNITGQFLDGNMNAKNIKTIQQSPQFHDKRPKMCYSNLDFYMNQVFYLHKSLILSCSTI